MSAEHAFSRDEVMGFCSAFRSAQLQQNRAIFSKRCNSAGRHELFMSSSPVAEAEVMVSCSWLSI